MKCRDAWEAEQMRSNLMPVEKAGHRPALDQLFKTAMAEDHEAAGPSTAAAAAPWQNEAAVNMKVASLIHSSQDTAPESSAQPRAQRQTRMQARKEVLVSPAQAALYFVQSKGQQHAQGSQAAGQATGLQESSETEAEPVTNVQQTSLAWGDQREDTQGEIQVYPFLVLTLLWYSVKLHLVQLVSM